MRLFSHQQLAPSISRRLGIGFGFIALVVFAIFCIVFFFLLLKEMQRSSIQELESKLDIVEHYIGEVVTESDRNALRHHLDDVLIGHGGLRIWIADARSNPLYGGDRLPELIPIANQSNLYRVLREDGLEMRGLKRPLAAMPNYPAKELIIALDVREQNKLFQYAIAVATLLSLVGVLMAFSMGLVFSKRSLKPLQKLSTMADKIGASSIDARLPEKDVDTEVKGLVASFNLALNRIEMGYRQQEAFNADVAHELNSPLAVLIAGNEQALRKGHDRLSFEALISNNLEDLHRLATIVKDMLFLAKAEQGALARRAETVSVAGLVGEVVDFYEGLLAQRAVTVQILGEVKGQFDCSLLKRAVSNLLSNALRYSPAGGEVVIRLETISATSASLKVENAGPMIGPEHLEKMCQRFFRADAARAEAAVHHGLGLAIVAGIAKMHGGTVTATSNQNLTSVGFSFLTHG
jgi:two-component system, OmpR family, heavy metal sensor histidine kinase CusS